MASQVDEDLVNILKNSLPNAKIQGWKYLLGLTATEDGLNHIIQFEKYVPLILSSIDQEDQEKELMELTYKCLINISNTEKGAEALLLARKDFVQFLLNRLSTSSTSLNTDIEYQCFILNNICAQKNILEQVTDILATTDALLTTLIKNFCSLNTVIRNKYNSLALVFGNITLLPSGRRLFLKRESNFLRDLLGFLHIDEPEARRIGVAITLKNCCFEKEHHDWLLNDLNILPTLLLPLIGSEEYDDDEMEKLPLECQYLGDTKEWDPCAQVRKILVEAISLFCETEDGWNYLKSKGVYYVVRERHKWETDPGVTEALETLAAYLLADQYAPTDGGVIEEASTTDLSSISGIREISHFVI